MYRYKAPHDGCTRHSVKGLKYINKLGKLVSIEAYTVGAVIDKNHKERSSWIDSKLRIIVRGEHGSCTFGGFSWGYGGEGPHGLIELLKTCGMTPQMASHYATSNALGEFNPSPHNAKLYNATTLWKFMNSEIGWNLIII
jgi:hypothetical protein